MNDATGGLAAMTPNLDGAAVLTVFWYAMLVAVALYTLYRLALAVRNAARNAVPTARRRLRRLRDFLNGLR